MRKLDFSWPAIVVAAALLCGVLFGGCATTGMPAGATFQQKLTADEMVLGAVKNDIATQCPKMAPVASLVAKALAIAMNPYDVLNDVTEALAAIPELKQDYDSIACAIKVVLADYKKYFQAAPAASPAAKSAAVKIDALERALVMMNAPKGDTCVASR